MSAPPRAASRLAVGAGRLATPATGRSAEACDAQTFAALALAKDAGLAFVDLAGDEDAERRVGRTAPADLRVGLRAPAAADGPAAAERRLRAAAERLRAPVLDTVLLRGAGELLSAAGEALWARLRALKAEGLVARIGFVARVADDPLGLARRFRPDVVQLPLSLLDQRALEAGLPARLAAAGVEVQLRSVFLHGLLFTPCDRLPAGLVGVGPRLSRVRRALAEAGADPLRAALHFALGVREASAVVVGVSSAAELRAVIAAAGAPAPAGLDWGSLALGGAPGLDEGWRRAAGA